MHTFLKFLSCEKQMALIYLHLGWKNTTVFMLAFLVYNEAFENEQ